MLTPNQAILGPHSKIDSFRPFTQILSQSITATGNQVNFGPHTVSFNPPHKNKSISFPTLKRSQNRSVTQNQVNSTPPLKSSQFYAYSKIKSISMPGHKNHVYFNPDTKSVISRPRHKTKSIPIYTLNQVKFNLLHWIEVKFDHPHKNLVKLNLLHKNEVNFDAPLISRQFRSLV